MSCRIVDNNMRPLQKAQGQGRCAQGERYFFLVVFLILAGCSRVSDDEYFEGTRTIKKQISAVEAVGPQGEYFQGKAKIDRNGDRGSWSMDATANDYHFKSRTTFSSGLVVERDNKGSGE
jgi:hypothetical protein